MAAEAGGLHVPYPPRLRPSRCSMSAMIRHASFTRIWAPARAGKAVAHQHPGDDEAEHRVKSPQVAVMPAASSNMANPPMSVAIPRPSSCRSSSAPDSARNGQRHRLRRLDAIHACRKNAPGIARAFPCRKSPLVLTLWKSSPRGSAPGRRAGFHPGQHGIVHVEAFNLPSKGCQRLANGSDGVIRQALGQIGWRHAGTIRGDHAAQGGGRHALRKSPTRWAGAAYVPPPATNACSSQCRCNAMPASGAPG